MQSVIHDMQPREYRLHRVRIIQRKFRKAQSPARDERLQHQRLLRKNGISSALLKRGRRHHIQRKPISSVHISGAAEQTLRRLDRLCPAFAKRNHALMNQRGTFSFENRTEKLCSFIVQQIHDPSDVFALPIYILADRAQPLLVERVARLLGNMRKQPRIKRIRDGRTRQLFFVSRVILG